MTFNDMVKAIRNKDRGIHKSVWKQYPMFAEDYINADIENKELCIYDKPQDAILDYESIYDDSGQMIGCYLTPGFDDANFTEIKLTDGKIINSLELDRKKKIRFDKISGIISWNDGFCSLYGNVVLAIDEDDLLEQITEGIPEGEANIIYLPYFQ